MHGHLLSVLVDFGELSDKLSSSEQFHEVLIVSDNNKLEVTLALSHLDDSGIEKIHKLTELPRPQ